MKNIVIHTKGRHGGGTSAISQILGIHALLGRLRVEPTMMAFLFSVLLLSGCTNDSFNKRTVIPEAEWRQEDRVAFDVDINDTLSPYRFGIGLRHLNGKATGSNRAGSAKEPARWRFATSSDTSRPFQ